ncbi:uncharacterized protein BXZ73DRAFT_100551 [Epithele typhae]|uniref:uncharacterized protein n=1 Tax=Epithele typhae TaxID=378194 RepID=UPI0020074CED|nr:uncharacterized protein BXZ73DRAFT_100551 [Epithele typhae]KAH9935164.1 hypothetical protein BXZ73DRAFT_100551 [Epithele typhae]
MEEMTVSPPSQTAWAPSPILRTDGRPSNAPEDIPRFITACINIPFPWMRWFKYEIAMLGNTLPPFDEEECFEPQMCAPVLPNDSHPTGRTPLVTHPSPFPFPGCFRWPHDEIDIRVLPRESGWDDETGFCLKGAAQMKLCDYWDADRPRQDELYVLRLRKEKALKAGIPLDYVEDCDGSSMTSSSEGSDILRSAYSDEPDEMIPIMDLRYELAEYLTAENIPDPRGIYEEIDEIRKIIEQSYSRSYTVYSKDLSGDAVVQTQAVSVLPVQHAYHEALDEGSTLPVPTITWNASRWWSVPGGARMRESNDLFTP